MATAPTRELKRSARLQISRGMKTVLAGTIILYIASAFFAPTSISKVAQMGMLPFAACLAIVGLGQTLVIQQGGIDLSVAGAVSLTVVIVTWGPDRNDDRLIPAVAAAFGAAIITGLVNGFLVTKTKLNSIVATLGVNALLYGVMMGLSGGSPRRTTERLSHFANDKTFGLPHSIYFGIILTIVVTVLLKRTVFGRRFEAVGANPRAAHATGLKIIRYQTQGDDDLRWNIKAEAGVLYERTNELALQDGVTVYEATNQATLNTETMLLNMDQKRAEGHDTVLLTGRGSKTTGAGFELDLVANTATVKGNVKTQYE